MGRILGVDFGLARIGLAITDENKIMALPIGIVRAGKTPKDTAELIRKELLRYKEIEAMIVGLPLQLNGKEGEMAVLARAFGQALHEALSIPVIYWDERLTSAQVERSLRDAGMNRKKRAQHSDELAATTILQNYLDSKR